MKGQVSACLFLFNFFGTFKIRLASSTLILRLHLGMLFNIFRARGRYANKKRTYLTKKTNVIFELSLDITRDLESEGTKKATHF